MSVINLTELRQTHGRELTDPQREHIEGIIIGFAHMAYKKYAAGQAEHGGNLWKKKIVMDEVLNEAVDAFIYADTLKQQIQEKKIELGDPKEKGT